MFSFCISAILRESIDWSFKYDMIWGSNKLKFSKLSPGSWELQEAWHNSNSKCPIEFREKNSWNKRWSYSSLYANCTICCSKTIFPLIDCDVVMHKLEVEHIGCKLRTLTLSDRPGNQRQPQAAKVHNRSVIYLFHHLYKNRRHQPPEQKQNHQSVDLFLHRATSYSDRKPQLRPTSVVMNKEGCCLNEHHDPAVSAYSETEI